MTQHSDTPDMFGAPVAQAVAAVDAATPGVATFDARQAALEADSVGARLKAARAARGWTIAECAARLHLPRRMLENLEGNDFGNASDFVFVRGALTGYARLLDLPPHAYEHLLREHAPVEQPALVAVARTPRGRWLMQRYGTAAIYIFLTATIAVPLVWLGLQGGLQRQPTRVVSLDSAPHSTVASTQPRAVAPAAAPAASAEAIDGDAPFRASMTPFAAMGLSAIGDTVDAAPASAAMAVPVPAGASAATAAIGTGPHQLTLVASGDCWFAVVDAAGTTLASGTLHAGDTRTFRAAGRLSVTLGNAPAVQVTQDGQPVALAADGTGSVARFVAFGGPAAGGEND